jgi:hypothetical protein
MSHSYTVSEMSARTKAICERGKFFIETGTSQSFLQFLRASSGRIRRYMPIVLVQRIADLINSGDRDSAITLWTKVCIDADEGPKRTKRILLFYLSYVVIGFMALYAFIRTILH